MYNTAKNTVEFKVYGRYALFSEPLTRVGGEKCSYHVPTYEALKGVLKSVYWKPTLIWIIDKVRVMKRIQTQTKGVKLLKYSDGKSDLSIYTFLFDVEYQVRAHFIWNEQHKALVADRNDGKHFAIAQRSLEKGGRQDIFLGTRDCQAYVEPCVFGEGTGFYDDLPELSFSLMFHGFDYPDETGADALYSRFWQTAMKNGVIDFLTPDECTQRKFVRKMDKKQFGIGMNLVAADKEWALLEGAL